MGCGRGIRGEPGWKGKEAGECAVVCVHSGSSVASFFACLIEPNRVVRLATLSICSAVAQCGGAAGDICTVCCGVLWCVGVCWGLSRSHWAPILVGIKRVEWWRSLHRG